MEALEKDCVRDLLKLIEQETYIKLSGKPTTLKMKHLYSMLDAYDSNQKYEAARYIFEKKLVSYTGTLPQSPRFYVCTGLSPLGHDFLQAIRDDNSWNRVKSTFKDFRDFAIQAIIQAAIVIPRNGL